MAAPSRVNIVAAGVCLGITGISTDYCGVPARREALAHGTSVSARAAFGLAVLIAEALIATLSKRHHAATIAGHGRDAPSALVACIRRNEPPRQVAQSAHAAAGRSLGGVS